MNVETPFGVSAVVGYHGTDETSHNQIKGMDEMKITTMTIAALALAPLAAFADPDIDMSQGISKGNLGIDISSQAVSGALIEGSTSGKITASVGAKNWSFAGGGFEQDVFLETDNAGPGVGGFGDGAIGGMTYAETGGNAWSDTSGIADKKGIQTVAGTFGSASVDVDFDTEWTLKSDDWN